MRHKNLFREHKLSRRDTFILYFRDKMRYTEVLENKLVNLGVQTFSSRKFRECQNSRNFWHKFSRMRHENSFHEHKLSRIDAFIRYLPEKIKQKRRKNEE